MEVDYMGAVNSIVRYNLMTLEGYSPYCGNQLPRSGVKGCSNTRTVFNGSQFVCPQCGFKTEFPEEFITIYKNKWGLSDEVRKVVVGVPGYVS